MIAAVGESIRDAIAIRIQERRENLQDADALHECRTAADAGVRQNLLSPREAKSGGRSGAGRGECDPGTREVVGSLLTALDIALKSHIEESFVLLKRTTD